MVFVLRIIIFVTLYDVNTFLRCVLSDGTYIARTTILPLATCCRYVPNVSHHNAFLFRTDPATAQEYSQKLQRFNPIKILHFLSSFPTLYTPTWISPSLLPLSPPEAAATSQILSPLRAAITDPELHRDTHKAAAPRPQRQQLRRQPSPFPGIPSVSPDAQRIQQQPRGRSALFSRQLDSADVPRAERKPFSRVDSSGSGAACCPGTAVSGSQRAGGLL